MIAREGGRSGKKVGWMNGWMDGCGRLFSLGATRKPAVDSPSEVAGPDWLGGLLLRIRWALAADWYRRYQHLPSCLAAAGVA